MEVGGKNSLRIFLGKKIVLGITVTGIEAEFHKSRLGFQQEGSAFCDLLTYRRVAVIVVETWFPGFQAICLFFFLLERGGVGIQDFRCGSSSE